MRCPLGILSCGIIYGILIIDTIFDFGDDKQTFSYYNRHRTVTFPLNAIIPAILGKWSGKFTKLL